MPTFDDREKQFEAKYSRDEQMQFKVKVRRNRLLGEWAGGQMGLAGEELKAYARTVVESDFEKPGDDDVVQKVLADLTGRGIEISEHRLRRRMDELLATAKQQVMTE